MQSVSLVVLCILVRRSGNVTTVYATVMNTNNHLFVNLPENPYVSGPLDAILRN